MLHVFEQFREAYFVTLFYPEHDVPFGSLDSINWPRIEMRTRQRFARRVSPNALVIGCNEVQARYATTSWQVHQHVLVANCTPAELEELRRRHFSPRDSQERLMQVVPLTNPARQIAYILKMNSFRFLLEGEKVGRVRKRLKVAEHNEFMRYLAQHTPMDLMFMLNAGLRKGGRLQINPQLMAHPTNDEGGDGKWCEQRGCKW